MTEEEWQQEQREARARVLQTTYLIRVTRLTEIYSEAQRIVNDCLEIEQECTGLGWSLNRSIREWHDAAASTETAL